MFLFPNEGTLGEGISFLHKDQDKKMERKKKGIKDDVKWQEKKGYSKILLVILVMAHAVSKDGGTQEKKLRRKSFNKMVVGEV